jgi:hypothetical protein
MTKLRTLLATALLMLPVMALSVAHAATGGNAPGTRVEPSTSLTGCCMIMIGGKWYCLPC